MKIISVNNLDYSLPSIGRILIDISFQVESGEFIGILGKNGEGKSTLLDLLLGFRTPRSGSIEILEEDPYLDERKNKQFVSYISQDIEFNGNFTVRQALDFHRLFYPSYDLELETKLCSIFKLKSTAKISTLSTGFQRRVQIISALASRPKLLVIDEITAVLDPGARDLLFQVLKDYQEQSKATIVMATNVIEDLKDCAHRILYLNEGRLSEESPADIQKIFSEKQAS